MAIGKTNVGGGSGGTLTVTAPAGCTVTVSKDGKAKTKTAGTDGVAVFKGLDTGEWTVTITDGADSSAIDVMIYNDTSLYISSNSYCGSNPGAWANFSVNGYASEEKLLADAPNENTIGVVTNTDVAGWFLGPTQPENMTDGTVWIYIGKSGKITFNALKKNGIQVYPIYAKQYVGGEWVNVEVKIYQGGEWADFIPEGAIYHNGYEATDITGGWSAFIGYGDGVSYHLGKFIKSDTSIAIGYDGKQGCSVYCGPVNAMDLTNVSKISINVTGGTVDFHIVVSSMRNNKAYDNAVAKQTVSGVGYHEFDISSISGTYYVSFGMQSYQAQNGTITFNEVRLI